MADEPMAHLVGRKLGDFVLREQIGEGGHAVVYRCEQRRLGRDVVVKVLHKRGRRNDAALDRFEREAQLASQLDHPYAAHVYAFGAERDGLLWIAMERVHGIALDDWLKAHGPMPLAQFVPFFEYVADVVHAAHRRGIIHRDLKPSNVMVIEDNGRLLPKLLDFGIAKLTDAATRSTRKLVVRREILRTLAGRDLVRVIGGAGSVKEQGPAPFGSGDQGCSPNTHVAPAARG